MSTTLFQDSFYTATAGVALESHTPTVIGGTTAAPQGGTWIKHPVDGTTMVISPSGDARGGNTSGSPVYYASVDPGGHAYTVSSDLVFFDNNGAFELLTHLDSTAFTCYGVLITQTVVQMRSNAAGAATAIGSNVSVALNTGAVYHADLITAWDGTTLTISVQLKQVSDTANPGRNGYYLASNGTTWQSAATAIITNTLTSPLAYGKAGLYNYSGGTATDTALVHARNFSVSTASTPIAAAPVFSPAAGTYTTPQTISMSSATAGASIYYTRDGSTPTTSSTLYSAPVYLNVSETWKAIAVASGYTNSSVTSASYTINYNPTDFDPATDPDTVFFVGPGCYCSDAGGTTPITTAAVNVLSVKDSKGNVVGTPSGTAPVTALENGHVCLVQTHTPINFGAITALDNALAAQTTNGFTVLGGWKFDGTDGGFFAQGGSMCLGQVNGSVDINGSATVSGLVLPTNAAFSLGYVIDPYVANDGLVNSQFIFNGMKGDRPAQASDTAGTGWSLGAFPAGSYPANCTLYWIAVVKRALTPHEIYLACEHYRKLFGHADPRAGLSHVIVCVGNSFVQDTSLEGAILTADNHQPFSGFANLAIGGMSTWGCQILYDNYADTLISRLIADGHKVVTYLVEGSNDLANNTTNPQKVIDDMQSLVTDCRTKHPDSPIVMSTIVPRSNDNETSRATANTGLRAITGVFIADIASDATMGNPANTSNTTYYSDGVHPTPTGNNIIGPYYGTATTAALATFSVLLFCQIEG